MQGVKTPEGELPEGQEKLAWAMRVQSTRIFKLFLKLKIRTAWRKDFFDTLQGAYTMRPYEVGRPEPRRELGAGPGGHTGRPYRGPEVGP